MWDGYIVGDCSVFGSIGLWFVLGIRVCEEWVFRRVFGV